MKKKKRVKISERVLIMMNSRHTGTETLKRRRRKRRFEGEEKL